ncbi:MAG TPA: 5'-deoxyadenosine deaminase [Bdellovibrionota bacterium]|jgi:cytosine/adenosine deaminase-related metal-dependent hydrolase
MSPSSFVFDNGFFLLNDGSGQLARGSLRVEKGRIAKVARAIPKKKGEKRVDLKGKLVIPGFVHTHIHLCQTLFRNFADDLALLDWLKERIWPFEGAHNERSLYASARLGIAELLAGGSTTILDMGTVRHTDSIFEAAAEMGIRAFIGKCLMDREESPACLREGTKQALQENLKLFERWHGEANDRLRYASAPRFLLSCTEGLLRELKGLSSANEMIVHSHSSENRDEVKAVRKTYGCENIEAFHRLGLTGPRLVLAHCIHLSDSERRILAETFTRVSHCPSSNLKLGSGVCQVPDLKKLGISVSLGADGAPCNNNLNMFQEMRLASLLQKPAHGPGAMPARETFEMATIEGARALGIERDVGSIEIGKKADLVALDLSEASMAMELSEKNPEQAYSAVVYSGSPACVRQTWIDGRLVFDEGSYSGGKVREIVNQALSERKKLLSRLNRSLN